MTDSMRPSPIWVEIPRSEEGVPIRQTVLCVYCVQASDPNVPAPVPAQYVMVDGSSMCLDHARKSTIV